MCALVTGVQTCALPISKAANSAVGRGSIFHAGHIGMVQPPDLEERTRIEQSVYPFARIKHPPLAPGGKLCFAAHAKGTLAPRVQLMMNRRLSHGSPRTALRHPDHHLCTL